MQNTLLSIVMLAVLATCAPTSHTYIQHEKRIDSAHSQWHNTGRAPNNTVLELRIGLTQSNTKLMDSYLQDIVDPNSSSFNKHWTVDEIGRTFAPSRRTISSVKNWIHDTGIKRRRIISSASRGWVDVNVTVTEAEHLLQTEYFVFEHEVSKATRIACLEYHVPITLRDAIDIVLPTVHFDTPANVLPIVQQAATLQSVGSRTSNLTDCSRMMTPDCLRALYRIPEGNAAVPGNSLGVVEFKKHLYLQEDLDMFFGNFSPSTLGATPIFQSINGGLRDDGSYPHTPQYQAEADLDLEYSMSLVYPQNVTLFQVGDAFRTTSFNNFLDALDSSYCTFMGGDDPAYDNTFPDPNAQAGWYNGTRDCGTLEPTHVISSSYLFNEMDLTPKYMMRQCLEYAKLGLQGVSVIQASGDFGVAGNRNTCIGDNNTKTNGTYGRFNPSFPSSCPYVTSVGATQLLRNTTTLGPEVACEQDIYSAGGFSNVFPAPIWQRNAMDSWFAVSNSTLTFGSERFNNSGLARGFPDVSANGANLPFIVDGFLGKAAGTSASAPIFAAVVSLINGERMKIGKKAIGFLNPILYQFPKMLNDIRGGKNPGCGTEGFAATNGWDPVTGLGTPDYPAMLEVFLALP